jgi:excinuclease ABC subunit C
MKSKLAKGKLDFNRQIGLYPDNVSKKEYQKTIRHIRLFFEAKKQVLIKELEKEMMQYARQQNFETANELKKRIFALKHIQDVALIKDDVRVYRDEKHIRIEAYDVAHASGKAMVGVMTVIEGGQMEKHEYRKFQIKGFSKSNDPGALQEVLERRLRHEEWAYPQIIVVDGNAVQKRVAERALREVNKKIPVVAVVKNNKHKPERIIGQADVIRTHKHSILLANAEAHRFAIKYHRDKRRAKQLS